MTPSKILFCLCLFFIAGIFIESAFNVAQIFILVFLFLSLLIIFLSFTFEIYKNLFKPPFLIKVAIATFMRNGKVGKNSLVVGFCFLFLILGILRQQAAEFNIKNDKLSHLNDTGENVILIGKIIDEPTKKDTTQNIKINVKKISATILITAPKYPEFYFNDELKIEGKLKTPFETEEFSYKNYLLKDKIYSVMSFPKIEIIQSGGHRVFAAYSGVLWLKQKIRESIKNNYLPPHSLILEGTILGDSSALTKDLKEKLNTTGLRHIIAVSGTHIIILALILTPLLLFLGLHRGNAFYFSILFIWFYIILTGLPASGIRAGIMATIFLLAEKLGRQRHTERIIIITASIMLFLNPLLLFYDIGFQLSFLAVMGLIYLEPTIKEFLKKFSDSAINFIFNFATNFKSKIIKIPYSLKCPDRDILGNREGNENKKLDNFLGMVSATLAAQIFTLPIMLYNFGNVSLIAPITNILILPIVPALMILGFLSSFFGMFFIWLPAGLNFLGIIFSLPCYFLLSYFLKILDIFSMPWAIKTFENVRWVWVFVLYFLLSVWVWHIKKRNRLKFLG